MKTLLVLTDFSKKASSAAEFAMHMAIKAKANLLLCHAMESVLPLPEGAEFNWLPSVQRLQEKCMTDLLAIGENLEKLIPEDAYRPEIAYLTLAGSLADVTLALFNERDIDLIVSGSHKTGGLLSFFSKSHSHSIMDKIDCPVLFIPEGLQFAGIKNLSYATDLSFSNAKVLPFLAKMATPFGASIDVHHISAGEFSSVVSKQTVEYSLRKLLKEHRPAVTYHCIKNANVRAALLEMKLSGQTDILTLVHKKYDFIDSLLHQSISKQLAGTAGVPLLVLPFSFSQNNADFSSEELDQFCYKTDELR